jgi:hypothetical protein
MEDLVYGGCSSSSNTSGVVENSPASGSTATVQPQIQQRAGPIPPAQPRYDWSELLARFPVVESEYVEKLRTYYYVDFNRTRRSRRFQILYSDFQLDIDPSLYKKFGGGAELDRAKLLVLFGDVVADCVGRAIRVFASPDRRPFNRVKISLRSGEMRPLNMQFINLDGKSGEMFSSMLAGTIQSSRDVTLHHRNFLSFIFI